MTSQVEGIQTRPVDDTDEIMAAVTASEKDFATRDGEITPSGGVIQSEGLWAPTTTPESQIANHVEPAVAQPTPEAVVTPAIEPLAVEPIKTEGVSMGDSVFTQKETPIESTPTTQNEAFGVNVVQDFPPAEGIIKEREENPSRLPGKQMPEFHEALGAQLEAGIAKADEKLENSVSVVEEDIPLPNPEESFEAHKESAKAVFAEMKKDLKAMNEVLDKKIIEAQKKFEDKTAQAESLETQAEDLKKQAEVKQMEAYRLRTEAGNEQERIQGEVSGEKAKIAATSERIESLQV